MSHASKHPAGMHPWGKLCFENADSRIKYYEQKIELLQGLLHKSKITVTRNRLIGKIANVNQLLRDEFEIYRPAQDAKKKRS